MGVLREYQELQRQLIDMGALRRASAPAVPAPPLNSAFPNSVIGLGTVSATEESVVVESDLSTRKETDTTLTPEGVPLSREKLTKHVATGCRHLPHGDVRIAGVCLCGLTQCSKCMKQCAYCGAATGPCCRGYLDGLIICSECEVRLTVRVKRTVRWLDGAINTIKKLRSDGT